MSYQQAQYTENDLLAGPAQAIKKDISIVIPVYNSEKTIGTLVRRLYAVLEGRYAFEIILVNDGSVDGSPEVLVELCNSLEHVMAINLSRNFGEHNAVMAGLNHARGEYVVTMDDDLQNPPEEVLKLIGEAGKGFDVVYGKYPVKNHSILRNIGSEINDLMVSLVIGKPAGLRLTSFRIMKRYMVREMIRYNAPYTYLDGMILRITGSIGTVTVEHKERGFGRSNYTFRKLVALWHNGMTNFSISPLRVSTIFGMTIIIGVILSSLMEIFEDMLGWTLPWWTPVALFLIFMIGLQMIFIGTLGEYIGRMFMAQNTTPQYVVRDIIGKGRTPK
jgi:glycosyltransferase involved in cell wall biosynthesis